MKRTTIAQAFTIAAVTALALSVVPAANAHEKGCSDATLNGSFAQKGTGVVILPPSLAGPIAYVGTVTFDRNGAINGTLINSLNGNRVPALKRAPIKWILTAPVPTQFRFLLLV